MIDQASAILRLLDDDEQETVMLVKRKLEEVSTVEALRGLRAEASNRAAKHLDDLIQRLLQRDADVRFTELCRSFPEQGEVEEACWLLAATFRPDEDVAPFQKMLDDWGAGLRPRLVGLNEPEDRVSALSSYMMREVGLRGNEGDYYNIDNSVLPRVVETRRGIPITMALVYQLVAKRAGLAIDGVGLPGHFVARHESVFFDPFHGGKRIGLEECAALLEQQNLVLTPQHLLPTSARQMLVRMLTNIYYIADRVDPPLASKLGDWIGMLRGQDA